MQKKRNGGMQKGWGKEEGKEEEGGVGSKGWGDGEGGRPAFVVRRPCPSSDTVRLVTSEQG